MDPELNTIADFLKNRSMNHTQFLYLLIIVITFYSCKKEIYQGKTNQSEHNSVHWIYNCKLTAIDLSEDVSKLSTKNDELILLVYVDSLNKEWPDLLYQNFFVFDHSIKSLEFTLNDSLLSNSILTFVLIEIDTKKNIKQIEPIVRSNLNDLLNAFQSDGTTINELLGDDDLLGIQDVRSSELDKKGVYLEFKGIHIFDSYTYQLEIRKLK